MGDQDPRAPAEILLDAFLEKVLGYASVHRAQGIVQQGRAAVAYVGHIAVRQLLEVCRQRARPCHLKVNSRFTISGMNVGSRQHTRYQELTATYLSLLYGWPKRMFSLMVLEKSQASWLATQPEFLQYKMQYRRLPGAYRADQGAQFSAVNLHRDVAQGGWQLLRDPIGRRPFEDHGNTYALFDSIRRRILTSVRHADYLDGLLRVLLLLLLELEEAVVVGLCRRASLVLPLV